MIIAPSILTADFTKLAEELKSVSAAQLLHIDIMDGHFVNNISFGPHITKGISQATKTALDVHLMVSEPLNWIEKFNLETVKYITIHAESTAPQAAIDAVKKIGKKVGITLKPSTDLSKISPYLAIVDLVLVMTVEPGFGGQPFMTDMLKRIEELASLRQELGYKYVIEVDGGVNEQTALMCQKAGADILVVGSYLFNAKDRNDLIKQLEK